MSDDYLINFPLDHKLRRKAEAGLGLGRFERVEALHLAPKGKCYWNADLALRRNGGSLVLGWMILWWPKLFITALHHAVNDLPDGRRVDVTQKPAQDNGRYTTFAPDSSIEIDLNRGGLVPNRYYVIAERPEVYRLIDGQEASLTYHREFADRMMKEFGAQSQGGELRMEAPEHIVRRYERHAALLRQEIAEAVAACDALARAL